MSLSAALGQSPVRTGWDGELRTPPRPRTAGNARALESPSIPELAALNPKTVDAMAGFAPPAGRPLPRAPLPGGPRPASAAVPKPEPAPIDSVRQVRHALRYLNINEVQR